MEAEVTVHIWLPMEFNTGGRNTGKRKQGFEYVNAAESSGVLNDMLDTFLSEWQRMVGHASLSVELTNRKPLYLGFAPKIDDSKLILMSAFGNKKLGLKKQEGVFRKHLPEDMFYMTSRPKGETLENKVVKLSEEKKRLSPNEINKSVIVTSPDGSLTAIGSEFTYPDEEVQLSLPDGEAIYKYVSNLTKMKKDYDLLDSNCSTYVIAALKEGIRSLQSDALKKVQKMGNSKSWEELKRFANVFSSILMARSDAYLGAQSLKHFVEQDGISVPNSFASLFEIQGKVTPNTVKRYAELLKESIG